jgi:hypothetical protein
MKHHHVKVQPPDSVSQPFGPFGYNDANLERRRGLLGAELGRSKDDALDTHSGVPGAQQ